MGSFFFVTYRKPRPEIYKTIPIHSMYQSTNQLPKELEFILCSIRPQLNHQSLERIIKLAGKIDDWEYIIKTASFQKVMPLLYQNLKINCPHVVPKKVLERMRVYSVTNARRNLFFSHELLKIINLFEEQSIIAIPFKGPILAQSLYSDISMRLFSDLDILVSKKDVKKAIWILSSIGYNPAAKLTSEQLKVYMNSEYSIVFFKDNSNNVVDLHWELTGRYSPYSFDLELLESRLDTTVFMERRVYQPSSEDLLLYLCIHGSKDCWRNLDGIASVSKLIFSRSDIDWARLEKRAKYLHCGRILHVGLFLAARYFCVTLPENIKKGVDEDPMVKTIAMEVTRNLFSDKFNLNKGEENTNFSIFHLKVKDKMADKISYLISLIFKPTRYEWKCFCLPSRISFLYYLLRPCLLAFGTLKLIVNRSHTKTS